MGMMLFALPVIATAAASANQWMIDNAPIVDGANQITSSLETINVKRNHTVALNEVGNIEGRIATIAAGSKASGLAEMKVFLVSEGKVQHEALTDSDGLFSLESVDAGVYSFVATGENGFAAYGVRVVEDAAGSGVNLMEAAAVSPNTSVVKEILAGELPGKVAAAILEDASVSETASNVVGSNKVVINGGVLNGHVIPMLGEVSGAEGTSVYIIQNNEQVGEATADTNGSFSVSNLEPGVYDFVAAGPTGFAAVSFEAIAGTDLSAVAANQEIPVSLEPGVAPAVYQDIPVDYGYDAMSSLDVCTTCGQDSGFLGGDVVYGGDEFTYDSSPIEYAGESVGCGCASGGSCGAASNFSGCNSCGGRRGLFGRLGGGGGGLFGGAGLGRIGLLAGVGTAVALGTSGGSDSIVDTQTPDDSDN